MAILTHAPRQHIEPVSLGRPVFSNFGKMLRLWSERARQRRHLTGLTQWELEDIGISREAALQEAQKPFWRA